MQYSGPHTELDVNYVLRPSQVLGPNLSDPVWWLGILPVLSIGLSFGDRSGISGPLSGGSVHTHCCGGHATTQSNLTTSDRFAVEVGGDGMLRITSAILLLTILKMHAMIATGSTLLWLGAITRPLVLLSKRCSSWMESILHGKMLMHT